MASSVLIADDDPAVRRLLRRILRDEFEVIEAGDGEEAIEAAMAARPSVVLLDVEMPRLDGHGALLRFRAEPGLRTTPVLIVSGAATGGEDAALFLRDGAHDFVRKPFEEVELVARVRAAHRLKAFEDALRSRNRELEAFASFAAHDLKSPLAAIASIVSLLTEGFNLTDEARQEFLVDIGDLATEGSRLVGDLLALAREDWSAAATATAAAIDVEKLVWAMLREAHLDDADIDVRGSWIPPDIPEAAVRSVFANLVSNASHYGRDGSGHLHLTITGLIENDVLVVLVEDQGPGISGDVADRIFEPFVVAAGSLKLNPSSTGLGLAIVGRTLQRHGGTIELLRDRRAGTTFRLTLPRLQGAGTTHPSE